MRSVAARLASALSLLLAGCVFLGLAVGTAVPAVAQPSNVETVSGPGPAEQSTLSRIPQRVTDEVSMRAVGVEGPDSTRWSLSVIGGDDVESFSFRAAGQTFKPLRVDRPDGVGPVSVYLSKEAFLTLARTEDATLYLDDTQTSLPASLRADMKAVYEEVV